MRKSRYGTNFLGERYNADLYDLLGELNMPLLVPKSGSGAFDSVHEEYHIRVVGNDIVISPRISELFLAIKRKKIIEFLESKGYQAKVVSPRYIETNFGKVFEADDE